MYGKCPTCKASVTRLEISGVVASAGVGKKSFNAITYNCPMCHSVLGCEIDPIALKTDTVAETAEAIARRFGQ